MSQQANMQSSPHERLRTLLPPAPVAEQEIVDRLLAQLHVVKLEKGRFVFHAGDTCDAFLILLSGSVRVQLTAASGREVTLYRIGPGGSCILTTSCLLSSDHYPAEAIAETELEAAAIPVAAFQEALERSAWFRRFVFDGFSMRLTSVIQKFEQLAFTSIDARLAAVLLAHEHAAAETITHQEIAVELGTAREVVSRHLKRFEQEGWIRLGRGKVQILDRARIVAIAGPSLCD